MKPLHSGSMLLTLATVVTFSTTSSKAQSSPKEVLKTWAEAYATMDGQRASAVYTDHARLWGTNSREQSVGREGRT